MGKKSKKPGGSTDKFPFVSVCTPTFNRRPFIPALIECFLHQDYPKDRLEWIIIDDGTDKIEDMVSHIPQVKYFKYDEQMVLGKKRNISNEKSLGDIIVYMDDDDYYCPTRISHAVHMLKLNPGALCAGGSKQLIYFKHIEKMYQMGPYGPNHATAGTFAFRRKLLDVTSFSNDAALAEEKFFLKNYTIPFVQLDYMQTSVMLSHRHNTFDKRRLLTTSSQKYIKEININPRSLIKNPILSKFYLDDADMILEQYLPGAPEMKPEVLRQQKAMDECRKQVKLERENKTFEMTDKNGKTNNYTIEHIVGILNEKENIIVHLNKVIAQKDNEIRILKGKLLS